MTSAGSILIASRSCYHHTHYFFDSVRDPATNDEKGGGTVAALHAVPAARDTRIWLCVNRSGIGPCNTTCSDPNTPWHHSETVAGLPYGTSRKGRTLKRPLNFDGPGRQCPMCRQAWDITMDPRPWDVPVPPGESVGFAGNRSRGGPFTNVGHFSQKTPTL